MKILGKNEIKRRLTLNNRPLLLALALLLCVSVFSACSGNGETENRIKMPSSSKDFKGANYQDVVAKLQDAGFTNVETIVLDDLVTGWLTKDGEVEQVEVGGYKTFSTDSKYAPDTKIVVSYHTFPAKETAPPENDATDSGESAVAAVGVAYSLDTSAKYGNLSFSVDKTWKYVPDSAGDNYYFEKNDSGDYEGYLSLVNGGSSGSSSLTPDSLEQIKQRIENRNSFHVNAPVDEPAKITIAGLDAYEFTYSGNYRDSDDSRIFAEKMKEVFFVDNEQTLYVIMFGVPNSCAEDYKDLLDDFYKTIVVASPTKGAEVNFPKEQAFRAAVVALTNYYANDVFQANGDDYDISKFHSYADVSGFFMYVDSEGTWSAKYDSTWHVDNLKLRTYGFNSIVDASLDVSFDGANYAVSNLSGKGPSDGDLSTFESESNAALFFVVPQELVRDGRDKDAEAKRAQETAGSNSPSASVGEKYPSGVSSWDGDHSDLKKLIKKSLNDEKSYKHIDTTWRYVESDATRDELNKLIAGIGWSAEFSVGDFLIITEFSAKNAYNATIKAKAYGIEYKDGTVTLLGIQ